MKKLFIILLLIGTSISILHAQLWISFNNTASNAPEVNVITSNTQTVSFEVTIPGIYRKDTIVNGVAFSRLLLPCGQAINPTGSPELSVLHYKIAIPVCDDVLVNYNVVSQQNVASDWVYPVPEIVTQQNPQGYHITVEQFAFNPTAYAQPCSAEPTATISSLGSLRSQHYAEIIINPVEFCPVSKQITITDKVIVTLTFTNSQGVLRQELGMFNKAAALAFINYEDDGTSALLYDRAFEKEGFTRGTVEWKTITTPNDAKNIEADYVMICAPAFFNFPQARAEIQRLAEHRAWYNGFSVSILNVEDILLDAMGFPFEDTNVPPLYKSEQRLRTCLNYIYYPPGSSSIPHDYESRLKYVLLIGDIELKPGDDGFGVEDPLGVPTSYEYGGDGASDYYFSCVTKQNNIYDNIGDFFIGRFCVAPNLTNGLEELHNMVEKTIYFESEFSFGSWRNSVNIFNGKVKNNNYWDVQYPSFIDTLIAPKVRYSANCFDLEYAAPALELMKKGSSLLLAHAHGWPEYWEKGLTATLLKDSLTNVNQTPFCYAYSCFIGPFHTHKCLAQQITSFSHDKGFVAMIAATIVIPDLFVDSTDIIIISPPFGFTEKAPYLIFQQHTHIVGEILFSMYHNNFGVASIFNLFGDPALNVMATGYQITQNVTAECPAELKSNLWVRDGATLTIPCDIYCAENVSITVDLGAKLIIDGGTLSNAEVNKMWQGIAIHNNNLLSYPTPPAGMVQVINGGTIKNATIGITNIYGGTVETNNAHFINNSIGVQVGEYSSASFVNTHFEANPNYLDNADFFGPHIKLLGSKSVTVSDCFFSKIAPQTIHPICDDCGQETGIWAFNAPLTVKSSTFLGLLTAVSVKNSGVTPNLSISKSIFKNNNANVLINAIDNAEVVLNEFFLPNATAFGLSIANSTGYKIEYNNFTSSSSAIQTTGILISNSGGDENLVNDNSFYDLNVGIRAIHRNSFQLSSSEGLPITTGLQFLCNRFDNTQQTDIFVGHPNIPNISHSVRNNQGNLLLPAGNLFINNQQPRINFGNYSNYPVTYDYSYLALDEDPITIMGNIIKRPIKMQSKCPLGKGRGNLENDLFQYNEWNAEYENHLAQLLNADEGTEEYDYLLNMVSYYSALKDNYFNALIVEEKNSTELQITGFERLKFLFSYRGQYRDYLSITETYLAENNFSEALTALNTMYKQFELNEEQILELRGMESYTFWLLSLEETSKGIYLLNEKEIEYLTNYVETNSGRGVVFAKNILCGLYKICLDEEIPKYTSPQNNEEGTTNLSKENIQFISDEQTLSDKIRILPNLTTGEFTITNHELQITNVELFDVYGRKLSSFNFSNTSGHININISNQSSGFYFVKIITKQGNIIKKIVKQ